RFLVLVTAPEVQTLGELVQAQLKEVGVTANIEVIDIPRFTERVQTNHDFDLYLGFSGAGPSPTADLLARWHTGGSINGSQLSDPQLDQMIDAQAAEMDPAKRIEALKQIQRRIIEIASVIPLAVSTKYGLSYPTLKNYTTACTGVDYYEYWNYQSCWFE